MFSNGSGTFTELFTEVTSLHLVNEITNSSPNSVIDQELIETYRYTDITLDGSGSSDGDGNIVSYNWYLNGEELIGTQQSLTYQFAALGDYLITLVVTDNEGAIGSTVSVVNVINQPPSEFELLSPTNNLLTEISQIEYENESLIFNWEESIDLDGDDLVYNCKVFSEADDQTIVDIDLSENQYSIPFNWENLLITMNNEYYFSWWVSVFDGYDEIVTSESYFSILYENLALGQVEITEFSLSQNYPNPFNPSTEIQFSLDKTEHVSLDVFDLSGRHIIQLLNSKQNIGNQTINWNALDKNGTVVPAGLYIYKLNSNSHGTIKKMMTLLK